MVRATAHVAENADVAQWQSTCFPSRLRGFDSRHRLGAQRRADLRIEWAPAAAQAAVGASRHRL